MKEVVFDIEPDTNTMDSIKRTGGSPAQNIMELIDNSIDAMYDSETGEKLIEKQDITIRFDVIKIGEHKDKLGWLITDKASGILEPKTVWILGASKKKKNLGKFGVGLKVASLSLGDVVWIETSTKSSNKRTIIKYNHKIFNERKKWRTPGLIGKEDRKKHYTNIFISDCGDKEPPLDKIRKELSRTYHKLLSNEVRVLFQDEELKWKAPPVFSQNELEKLREMYHFPDTPKYSEAKIEFTIYITDKGKEHKIEGWVGIKKKENPELDGIDIFRADRLIESGSNIGIGLQKQLIYGQIEVGYDFPVNFHKTSIDRSEAITKSLDIEVEKTIRPVINIIKYIQKNKGRKTPATLKRLTNINQELLSNALNKGLRKMMKDLMDSFEIHKENPEGVDSGEIDVRLTKDLSDEQKKKLKTSVLTKPRERKPPQGIRDPIDGQRFKLEHSEDNLGVDFPLSKSTFMRGTLYVVTNVEHPLYTKYETVYRYRQIAELHLQNLIFEISKFFSIKHDIDRDGIRDKIQRLYSQQDLSKLK